LSISIDEYVESENLSNCLKGNCSLFLEWIIENFCVDCFVPLNELIGILFVKIGGTVEKLFKRAIVAPQK
jgi:hypothetical protein